MEMKELQDALSELKSQGLDEEKILGSLYKMFVDGEIDLNQLEAIADEMGYKLTDEFKNLSDEEKKKYDLAEEEAKESHPELNEDATEVGEDDEEDEDEDIADDDEEEDEDEDAEESEEDEEDEAMKYFGLNKDK